MIFDAHTHTEISSDSKMNAVDALIAAEKLGIGIIFTEHYDFDYRKSVHFKDMDFLFDPQEYFEKYEPLRRPGLLLGIEVGLTAGSVEANRQIVRDNPFDQVIGSIHAIDGYDIYYPDIYEGKTKAQVFTQYFQAMADMVAANPFIDVLGHIDYICRYAPYDNKGIEYPLFHEAIDQVLENVMAAEVVLELNTRRLHDKATAEELIPVYRRYREMGGRFITIGSDAHVEEHVGMNFELARDLADHVGLQPVYFKNRKLQTY